MKRALLSILLVVAAATPAAAREVLVVQGMRSAMYDEAVKGFRSTCSADASVIVLSEFANPELARVIQEERPRLIVAVGDSALALLHKVRKVPVLSVMALGLHAHEGEAPNVAGVGLMVKPEQYLAQFKRIKARRVGVIYDPARTGWYVRLARAAAKQYGVELVLREVGEPRQPLSQLASLRGSVDALWLLPDATAVTSETLEAYFLFAQRQSIPVVSFSAAHLRLGALFTLEADRVELGKQAGEMAQQLLRGARPAELAAASPRKVSIRVNDAVAKRLSYPAELMGLSKK